MREYARDATSGIASRARVSAFPVSMTTTTMTTTGMMSETKTEDDALPDFTHECSPTFCEVGGQDRCIDCLDIRDEEDGLN